MQYTGRAVEIQAGKYDGQVGMVISETERMITVYLNATEEVVDIRKSSVDLY